MIQLNSQMVLMYKERSEELGAYISTALRKALQHLSHCKQVVDDSLACESKL
jgi:hypothetical protein